MTYPPEDAPTHLIVPAGLRRGGTLHSPFVYLGDGAARGALRGAGTKCRGGREWWETPRDGALCHLSPP